jgi:hypothetical protein
MNNLKYLVLIVAIATSKTLFCQNIIKVKTALEFANAIGSDITIEVIGDIIDISNLPENFKKNNCEIGGSSGQELVISNVNNLTIQGIGASQVKLITKPTYGNVLVFEKSSNIKIENIFAGHGPEKGECIGGVFKFIDSKKINIKNSTMDGSGIEGIRAINVTDLIMTNSIITNCTSSILSLFDCRNISFEDCDFKENKNYNLIRISSSIGVSFLRCKIKDNFAMPNPDTSGFDVKSFCEWFNFSYSIFDIDESISVKVTECIISNNESCNLSKNKADLELINCVVKNNVFYKMYFNN